MNGASECKGCYGNFCWNCSTQHAPRLARFRIMSVNDIYTVEGFAKIHSVVNKKRAGGKNSMFCVNGDFLGGSALAVRTQGHALVTILNAMKVDSVVIGNHEFDYAAEGLASCMKKSQFRWFGSNILNTSDGKIFAGVTDTHVFTVPFEDGLAGGVKIGMFGVCTAATPSLSYPGPNVRFQDVISASQQCVQKLRAQGAQIIVALTHVSMHQDREIAKNVEGLSLLLGGHDHTPFAETQGNALILKFGQNGEHLGVVDLDMIWDPTKPEGGVALSQSFRMLSTANMVPSPEILHLASLSGTSAEDALANQEELVILKSPLSTLTIEGRLTGASFGYVVADAFVKYHNADLGLINGGFMRGDKRYPARTVFTVGMIREELPFPREVVLLSIRGKDLLQAIEEELAYLPALSGSFPHVSAGWTLHYDPAKPVGSRVESLQHKGVPLNPERMLAVALTSFMATGGDKCPSFTKGTITSQPNPLTVGNVVIMYLRGLRDSMPSAGANRSQLYELEVPSPRLFAAKFSPTLAEGPIQPTKVNSSPPSSLPVSSVDLTVPAHDGPVSQSLSPRPGSHLHTSHSNPNLAAAAAAVSAVNEEGRLSESSRLSTSSTGSLSRTQSQDVPPLTIIPDPTVGLVETSTKQKLEIKTSQGPNLVFKSFPTPSAASLASFTDLATPSSSLPPSTPMLPLHPSASFSVPAITSFYLSPLSPALPDSTCSPSSMEILSPLPSPDMLSPAGSNGRGFPPDDNQFRHGLTNACTQLAVMGAKFLARIGDLSRHDLSLMFLECKNPSVHGQMAEILEGDRSLQILTEAFPNSGFMSPTNVEWSEKGLRQIFHELSQQKGTVSCPVTFGGYTLCLHRVEMVGRPVTYFLVDTHNVDQKGALILKAPSVEPLMQHLRDTLPKHGNLSIHGSTMEYCIFRVRDVVTMSSPPAPKRPALGLSQVALSQGGVKICSKCTFHNPEARTLCNLCGTDL